MKIRGDRECQSCGTRWSYYDTGSVECPQCGSLRSVGVDDRTEHTASAVTLDLTEVRDRIDDDPLSDLATDAAERCREYVRQQGFIDAGDLRALDDTYLAALELVHAAAELDHSMRVDDDEEYYVLDLLRGADRGERPGPSAVPASMRAARGLAYARAVGDYHDDLRTYLDGDHDELARDLLGSLAEHRKRVEALDGDVSLADSEALIGAAQAVGHYLAEGDENALAQARHHLDNLDPDPRS
ncbi:MAG: TFIIB-type zinc ribbon-containing protein [Halorientalis sp.]